MKEETNGLSVVQFVRLKSKMYSLILITKKTKRQTESIKMLPEKHKEHEYMIFEKKRVRYEIKIMQSKYNEVGTYNINKISLSRFGDKRYTLDDGIKTEACLYRDIDQLFQSI